MTNESKLYPSIDDVPRPQTPDMSETPPTSMPLSEAPLPHTPNMSETPPNSMALSEPPSNSMPKHQASSYPMPQSTPNPRPHVGLVPLGPTPNTVTCPSCGASTVSSVRMEPSTETHLIAMVLCFLCICLTCAPYCVDSCQDVNHYCRNCDAYLGTFRR